MTRQCPVRASRPPSHAKLRPVGPVLALSGLACGGAGLWALWPLPTTGVPGPDTIAAELDAAQQPPALARDTGDPAALLAAFETPLWFVAAAPEPAPTPVPTHRPAPPLRATLLAIARDGSYALVHDQDGIATLRPGAMFQGRTVARIEASRITLAAEGQPPQTLELGYTLAALEPLPAPSSPNPAPHPESASAGDAP